MNNKLIPTSHRPQTQPGLILLAIGLSAWTAWGQTAPEDSAYTNRNAFYGFGPMEILKLEWEMGRPVIVDINQDGLNDILITNNRKARIEILLQKKDYHVGQDIPLESNPEDINDIFGKEKNWRFRRFSYPLDVAAENLVVADLNGDQWLDLAYYAKDGLRIALQDIPSDQPAAPDQPAAAAQPASQGPAPAPSAPQETESTGLRPPVWLPVQKIDIREGLANDRALAAGDLDSDGRNDLVLLAADGAFVLRQKPDGTLDAPTRFHSASDKLKQLHIADIDGDQRHDLVFLTAKHEEYPLLARLQTPSGQLGPELRFHLPVPTVLEVMPLADSDQSHFFSVAQQGGRMQLYILPSQPQSEGLAVYTHPLPTTEKPENRDVVSADLDGDGLLDVVVSDPARAEFMVFHAHAQTSLTTPESFPGLKDMRKLCAGDLDGSGKDHLVVLSFDEKIIGLSKLENGRLTFPETVALQGEPQAMDLADLNADQQLDLVYIAKEKDSENRRDVFWLRSVLSVGRENAAAGAELALTEIKDKPLDVRTADIDHDGRIDVMIFRSYEPLLLVRQISPGGFAEERRTNIHSGLVATVFPNALSVAPLGPQGLPAALLAQKNFARALIFEPNQGWQVVDQYQGTHPQSNITTATACRLTPEDSDVHIVTYDAAQGDLALLAQQEDGTYRARQQVDIGNLSAQKILAGNFGGSSPVSLLVCGHNQLIRISVDGQSLALRQIAGFEPDIKNGRFGALTVGDINNDGCPDILLCEQARHHVEILSFDLTAELVSVSKFKVFEQPAGDEDSSYLEGRREDSGEPRNIAVADVTDDGKNDLILLVHDRIIIYPQD